MPDFVGLLDDIDFVDNFGALEELEPADVPQAAEITMKDVARSPVAVHHDCGLIRAFAMIIKHQLRDLPVVDDAGQLVGIASRVDIGRAFLSMWTEAEV